MSTYRCLNCRCDLGRRNRGRGYCQNCHQENVQVKQRVKDQEEKVVILENHAQGMQEAVDIQKQYMERQNTDIGEIKATLHGHNEDMEKMQYEVASLRLELKTQLEIAQENRKMEEAKALQEQAKAKQEEAKAVQEDKKLQQEEAKARQEELRLEQEEIKLKQEEMKVQQEKAKAHNIYFYFSVSSLHNY